MRRGRRRVVRVLVLGLAVVSAAGCVSAPVWRGAAIGAAGGATAGVALGYAVSDEALLGASTGGERGDMSLGTGQAVLSGALVGALFGGLVGAMAGHQLETPKQRRALESARTASPATIAGGQPPPAFTGGRL